MQLSEQTIWLFLLALPIASITWTATHKDIFDVEKDLESDPDHDVTGLMKDAEKFKNRQLNVVYKIFLNARKEILE